jgi:hypothetical protein
VTLQRYVADELTHLTGRNKEPEDAYAALVSILTSGTLRHSGEATPRGTFPLNPLGGGIAWNPAADLIGHEMFLADMVCFCDIPIADMALHARKYSPFGLAFPKRFLLEQGATPVFYVARNAAAVARSGSGGSLADVFTDEVRRVHDFFRAVRDLNQPSAGEPTSGLTEEEADRHMFLPSMRVFSFLATRLFSYVKFFDADLPQDDERNYYMEREWRSIGGVSFSLGDVRRLLLPEKYAARLREDVPDYHGQVSFLDP